MSGQVKLTKALFAKRDAYVSESYISNGVWATPRKCVANAYEYPLEGAEKRGWRVLPDTAFETSCPKLGKEEIETTKKLERTRLMFAGDKADFIVFKSADGSEALGFDRACVEAFEIDSLVCNGDAKVWYNPGLTVALMPTKVNKQFMGIEFVQAVEIA